MSQEIADWARPKWSALFVVCKDCRKRKNGPEGLKPKKVLRAIRDSARETKPRPRVVLSNCLGLCPKGATAMACAGQGNEFRVIAISSMGQLEAALADRSGHQVPKPLGIRDES